MAKELTELPDLSAVDVAAPNSVVELLKPFTSSNQDVFAFTRMEIRARREFADKILTVINDVIPLSHDVEVITECLKALLIMSRDAPSVHGTFNTKRTWDNLSLLAGLKTVSKESTSECLESSEDIAVLCLKCLSNLLFITKDSERYSNDAEFLQLVINKLSSHGQFSVDLEFFYVRLLFLVTALNKDARSAIVHKCNGRQVLTDMLTAKLSHCSKTDARCPTSRAILPAQEAKSCREILKTLFNVNIKADRAKVSEVIVDEFDNIISICRKLLLTKIEDDEDCTRQFHTDVANCLYSVALTSFNDTYFTPEICDTDDGKTFSYCDPDIPVIENRDLSAVQAVLSQLEIKLNDRIMSTDSLVPILSLLSVISRSSKVVRKYCKKYIIPPRKNFTDRPEMGSKLRNKLIKLFTHANTEVKGAAADFIFVLCKENVDRLVKYTGYGNAAGLLASRGLLAGGRGSTAYSDSDSDSDTEEYRENLEKINPITGHIPPEISDPMKDMSDEQKEYLAVQLANELAKLSNDSVIKPVCIDPNTGKLISFQQKVHETVIPEEKSSDEDSD